MIVPVFLSLWQNTWHSHLMRALFLSHHFGNFNTSIQILLIQGEAENHSGGKVEEEVDHLMVDREQRMKEGLGTRHNKSSHTPSWPTSSQEALPSRVFSIRRHSTGTWGSNYVSLWGTFCIQTVRVVNRRNFGTKFISSAFSCFGRVICQARLGVSDMYVSPYNLSNKQHTKVGHTMTFFQGSSWSNIVPSSHSGNGSIENSWCHS